MDNYALSSAKLALTSKNYQSYMQPATKCLQPSRYIIIYYYKVTSLQDLERFSFHVMKGRCSHHVCYTVTNVVPTLMALPTLCAPVGALLGPPEHKCVCVTLLDLTQSQVSQVQVTTTKLTKIKAFNNQHVTTIEGVFHGFHTFSP